jgi:hypothetical protein
MSKILSIFFWLMQALAPSTDAACVEAEVAVVRCDSSVAPPPPPPAVDDDETRLRRGERRISNGF